MRTRILFLCAAVLAAASAAYSQSQTRTISQKDYRAMAEEAMKSRNYRQDQAENWDARLKRVSGTVTVKPSEDGKWSQIEGEIPLNSSDWIKTGSDGIAELYLDAKAALSVGRNTEFQMSSLAQTETVFTLKSGSLSGKIGHLLNKKYTTQVRTPSAVCAVTGSEFAVEYSLLGKDTGAGTFDEGRVTLSPLDDSGKPGEEYVLEKNMELFFNPAQKRFRAVKLSRMSRYRTGVSKMRSRLSARRKSWKPVSPAARKDLRDAALKRKVLHRQVGPGSRQKKGKKTRPAARKGVRRKAARE